MKTYETLNKMQLKEERQKLNLEAILVGSTGSIVFVTTLILLEALEVEKLTAGYIMVFVIPFMMVCWGFAIWRFVMISRISEEIRYLERVELINLQNCNEK